MSAAALRPPHSYDGYLAEGAQLLSRLCDSAHLALVNGRLIIVAEIGPALADALANWGAELTELEPEDAL